MIATPLLTDLLTEYDQAKKAHAAWKAQEKNLRAAILDALGYEPDDSKPEGVTVTTGDGETEVFKVTTGTWRGLDQKYLKEHHPDVYAECESSKVTLKITYPPFSANPDS